MLIRLITILSALSLALALAHTGAGAQALPGAAADSTIDVDTISHSPHFVFGPGGYPGVQCIVKGMPYRDSLYVSDYDLGHDTTGVEIVHLNVLEPSGFTITPSVINAPLPSDTFRIYIASFHVTAPIGKLRIVLEAIDAEGHADTVAFYISVSEVPDFVMPIVVRNTNTSSGVNAEQTLTFGIGKHATTGAEPDAPGRLDSNYCEYELPPAPPVDLFDARWLVPATNGTLRSIYPELLPDEKVTPWVASFQTGDYGSGGSYPVRITWSKTDARRSGQALYLHDPVQNLFAVNMQTGALTSTTPFGFEVLERGDSLELRIGLANIEAFAISPTIPASVPPPNTDATGIARLGAISNASSGRTSFNYYIPAAADISLEIVDTRGNHIRSIAIAHAEQGAGEIVWDGCDEHGIAAPSGPYVCRLSSSRFAGSCKMVVVR